MTSKLTADKARERIAHLTAWRDQRGLTLREEEYLEAMQLALSVLDTQPVALPAIEEKRWYSPGTGSFRAEAYWLEARNVLAKNGVIIK